MSRVSEALTLAVISDPRNLFVAAANARRGKSRRPDVEAWWLRRESEVGRLSVQLAKGAWKPAGYRFFEIREPKRRIIAAAPFADRVVHHALCQAIQPALERHFIARSFSCQIGKGTTAARDCCRRLTNRHRFVLKCDVAKFFPSIDHAVLASQLATFIRCPDVLRLCSTLIASYQTIGCARPCGLPIGNLTSQLWGNLYLDGLDHFLTEEERHGAYVRYTDDFLLFSDRKARLWQLREMIVEKLSALHMRLSEPKSRLLATCEGVPFCGFRFLPGQQPRILGPTKRRFEKRRHRMWEDGRPFREISGATFAWYQFSREANAEGLRRAYSQWPMDARLRQSRKKPG